MRAIGFAGVIFLGLLCEGIPHSATASEGHLVRTNRQEPVSYSAIRRERGIIALTFLGVDWKYLAVAKRMAVGQRGRLRALEPPWDQAVGGDTPIDYVVDFYRRKAGNFYQIARANPGYILVGMYSELGEGADRLITTWETGSAQALIIFARRGDEIREVFSWAGKTTPEYVGLANNGVPYLVVTDGEVFETEGKTTYPETASIYAWEGSGYVLQKKVSWEKRFEALRDSWPAAYPKRR